MVGLRKLLARGGSGVVKARCLSKCRIFWSWGDSDCKLTTRPVGTFTSNPHFAV
jgi:hypothetical protein